MDKHRHKVRVSPETYRALILLQGELQVRAGKRVSLGALISHLVNDSNLSEGLRKEAS